MTSLWFVNQPDRHGYFIPCPFVASADIPSPFPGSVLAGDLDSLAASASDHDARHAAIFLDHIHLRGIETRRGLDAVCSLWHAFEETLETA